MRTLQHVDQAPLVSVRFSPSSLQLLAMSLDSAVRLWDLANARVLKTYTGHVNTKYAGTALFAYLPSAALPRTLVVAPSEDRELYLWDLQTKQVVQKLIGHRDAVATIAVRLLLTQVHPTLPVLASAGLEQDASIRLWVYST